MESNSNDHPSEKPQKSNGKWVYTFIVLLSIYATIKVITAVIKNNNIKATNHFIELENSGSNNPKANLSYKSVSFKYPNSWNLKIDSILHLVECDANGYGYSIGYYDYDFPIDKVLDDMKTHLECSLTPDLDKLSITNSPLKVFKGLNVKKVDYEITGIHKLNSELIAFYLDNKTYYLYRFAPTKPELIRITSEIDSTLIIK